MVCRSREPLILPVPNLFDVVCNFERPHGNTVQGEFDVRVHAEPVLSKIIKFMACMDLCSGRSAPVTENLFLYSTQGAV